MSNQTTMNNIDIQSIANQLFEKDAKLVILGFPANHEFGIDLYSFRAGPNFKGIKLIPPGLHVVYYSSVDQRTNIPNFMTCFIMNMASKEIYIKNWNVKNESLEDLTDLEQVERIKLNRSMGPYPLFEPNIDTSYYKQWLSLTKNLNKNNNFIKVLKVKTEENYINVNDIKYTEINLKKSFPKDSLGKLRTQYALDKSYLLENIITTDLNNKTELELSFVVFYVAQNYNALEQWKNIVALISMSKTYINRDIELYMEFLDVLKLQLSRFPEDFFEDIMDENNFLNQTIRVLVNNLQELKLENQFKNKLAQFIDFMKQKFNFLHDTYEETGEYAPTIV